MRLKPNFKPTIGKIIFSAIITILWLIYSIIKTVKVNCDCSFFKGESLCHTFYLLMPVKNYVCCGCATLLHLIIQIIIYIIVPFIIAYLVYTLIYSLMPRKHKHGVYR